MNVENLECRRMLAGDVPLGEADAAEVPAVVQGVKWEDLNGDGVRDDGEPGLGCLLYTSPSPRDATLSRMPSSA